MRRVGTPGACGAPDPISLRGRRQRPARPSAANRTPAMASVCRYAAGGARWGPRAVARELGRRWQSLPKVGTAYRMPPMRSSAASPPAGYATYTPGAPATPYACRPVSSLSAWGALPAPPIMLREAARVLPGRRQKRRWDVWTARVMGRPPRGPLPPVERQRFRGYVGRVAQRRPTAILRLWPT